MNLEQSGEDPQKDQKNLEHIRGWLAESETPKFSMNDGVVYRGDPSERYTFLAYAEEAGKSVIMPAGGGAEITVLTSEIEKAPDASFSGILQEDEARAGAVNQREQALSEAERRQMLGLDDKDPSKASK